MIDGNNCKLSESSQKLPEKSVTQKSVQKNKSLPEKTKFTLQYSNSSTSQTVKNTNKKVWTSLTPLQSSLPRSSRENLTIGQVVRGKTATNQNSTLKEGQPTNDRQISSLPYVPRRLSTKSSVSTLRNLTKTPRQGLPDSNIKAVPTKPECKRSTGYNIQSYSHSKAEMRTASGKALAVAKSRKKSEIGSKSFASDAQSTKPATLCPIARVPDNKKFAAEDTKVGRERSRSQEITRIASVETPIKQDNPERKFSEEGTLFKVPEKNITQFGERLKTWDLRNVDLQEETLTITSPSPVQSNASEDCPIGEEKRKIPGEDLMSVATATYDENISSQDSVLRNYSLRLTEDYHSLEPVERDRRDEELLKIDKKIWNNLEEQIRETCERTENLCDIVDDSCDSYSEMIQQSYSNREDFAFMECFQTSEVCADPQKYNYREEWNRLSKEWRSKHDKEMEIVEPQSKESFEKPRSRKPTEDTAAKTKSQKSKRTKSSESSKIRNVKQEFRTKSLSGDIKCQETTEEIPPVKAPKERKIVNFVEDIKQGSETFQTSSSSFFNTHKNLGFIGKDVDQEYISFQPDQVTLYQPNENQMLLYDIANCVATQGYLKMCGINYNMAIRKNAEQMSPSGRVPFISSSLCIIPEFEAIVSFMQYKKFACVPVQENDQPAFRAVITMIVDILEAAERYICWYDSKTLSKYTKPRIEGQYPFPLNHIMHWKKSHEEKNRLSERGFSGRSFELILSEINSCFRTLSHRLSNKTFFFGNVGTEVDALVYGHVYALFTTDVDGALRELQFIIQQYPNLITFARNFDKTFCLGKFSTLQGSYWDNLVTDGKYPSDATFSSKT